MTMLQTEADMEKNHKSVDIDRSKKFKGIMKREDGTGEKKEWPGEANLLIKKREAQHLLK